jgi:hypothetical protein
LTGAIGIGKAATGDAGVVAKRGIAASTDGPPAAIVVNEAFVVGALGAERKRYHTASVLPFCAVRVRMACSRLAGEVRCVAGRAIGGACVRG